MRQLLLSLLPLCKVLSFYTISEDLYIINLIEVLSIFTLTWLALLGEPVAGLSHTWSKGSRIVFLRNGYKSDWVFMFLVVRQ